MFERRYPISFTTIVREFWKQHLIKGVEHIRLEALKDDVGISCYGQTGWICRRMDGHQLSNVKSNFEKQYIFAKLKSTVERNERNIILI